MDRQMELSTESNEVNYQKWANGSYKEKEGVYLSNETIASFSKISPAYLGSFIKIKHAFLMNTTDWIKTNPTAIHEVLGYSNGRNVYYVLHELENCGVITVRFMRRKGIHLKLTATNKSQPRFIHRHIAISSGETLTISVENKTCI